MANFLDERLPIRFWDKVQPEPMSGCWLWTAAHYPNGYGTIRIDGTPGRMVSAHRLAYEMLVGPISNGLEIDHRCRQRCCVNPAHMEPVTHAENVRRQGAAISHCKRGHEFTPENTQRHHGRRQCRACAIARLREDWRQNKEARNRRRREARAA